MATGKKKYRVITAQGETVEIEGVTAVVKDDQRVSVTFYDGDDVLAEFRGYSAFLPA